MVQDLGVGQSIPSDLTIIKDAPHPFLGKQAWFDEMIEMAGAFFEKNLKDRKSAASVAR